MNDWGNCGWGEERYKLQEPDSPLVLEDVLYIQTPDGTKISKDGTVEYAAKAFPPSAALNYKNNASTTDVYAYYADYDGDGAEDMAVWYDGAFRAVCLLDAAGAAKKTYSFEAGVDIYHTYNQRATAIKHEPNLIRILGAEDNMETVRYCYVKENGLHLNVGVKYDPGGTESIWFCSDADASVSYDASTETWKAITEETYQRIIDDYQVMQYRLIPIA